MAQAIMYKPMVHESTKGSPTMMTSTNSTDLSFLNPSKKPKKKRGEDQKSKKTKAAKEALSFRERCP